MLMLAFLAACVSVTHTTARQVSIYTQTNVSGDFMADPNLMLPFTSIFYISAGVNSALEPPTTVRVAQVRENNSTLYSPPVMTIISHSPNFTMPSVVNTPSGIVWHELYIGELPANITQSWLVLTTYGTGVFLDIWLVLTRRAGGLYTVGVADENELFKIVLRDIGMAETPGGIQYTQQVNKISRAEASLWVDDEIAKKRLNLASGRHYALSGRNPEHKLYIVFDDSTKVGTGRVSEGLVTYTYEGPESMFMDLKSANPHIDPQMAIQPLDDPKSMRGLRDLTPLINPEAKTPGAKVFEVSAIRKGGRLTTMVSFSKVAANSILAPFLATAAIFIILDWVHREWQAAATGTCIITLGVLLPLYLDNPIGWFIGSALAIFFTIMPGLGKEPKPLPLYTNTTQILQYVIWKDRDKTGNEDCEKSEKKSCQVAYGAGLFENIFHWEYFDGVAFLLHANQGFPMTIPDMAKAFTVQPVDALRNKSSPAQITCGVSVQQLGEHAGRDGHMMPRYTLCDHPKLWINRDAIMIPRLNQTAAQIYPRIIKEPGQGDCKIIDASVNPVTLPDYSFTVRGLPVAIACGIKGSAFRNTTTAGETAPITARLPSHGPYLASSSPLYNTSRSFNDTVAVDNATLTFSGYRSDLNSSFVTNITNDARIADLIGADAQVIVLPAGVNSANQSTNGRAGEAYVPPPQPTGFLQLNSQFAACFRNISLSDPFCLPNGTYGKQTGTWGYDTKKFSSMTCPPSTQIRVTYVQGNANNRGNAKVTETYLGNQSGILRPLDVSGKIRGLFSQMALLWTNSEDKLGGLNISISVQIKQPYACLYTGKSYTGDVICLGLGAGNLTNMKAKVASVQIAGGAVVTMYPNKYGDIGSQRSSVSIPDLSTYPYGTNGDMVGRVQALWISNSSQGIIA